MKKQGNDYFALFDSLPDGLIATAFISENDNNRLILYPNNLPPVTYRINGWIEVSFKPIGKVDKKKSDLKSIRLVVESLNIKGTLEGESRPHIPKIIHGTLTPGRKPQARLDLGEKTADFSFPFAFTYDELHDYPERLLPAPSGQFPSAKPLVFDAITKAWFNHDGGKCRIIAAGYLEPFPGIAFSSPIPGLIVSHCICREGTKCLIMDISIKVAIKDEKAVIIKKDILDILHKINMIWDCNPPAQCCIRFNDKETLFPRNPPIPHSPIIDPGNDISGFDEISRLHRHGTYYDVYFVHKIKGDENLSGVTGEGARALTVLDVMKEDLLNNRYKKVSIDELARTLAHELGHALGLAWEVGASNSGVESHSSKLTNLMYPLSLGSGTNLNKAQCTRARESRWVKNNIGRDCTLKPKER